MAYRKELNFSIVRWPLTPLFKLSFVARPGAVFINSADLLPLSYFLRNLFPFALFFYCHIKNRRLANSNCFFHFQEIWKVPINIS